MAKKMPPKKNRQGMKISLQYQYKVSPHLSQPITSCHLNLFDRDGGRSPPK